MKKESIFKSAEIMIPKYRDLSKWSVIACDQFTSNPGYWDSVQNICRGVPAALDLILPEVWLNDHTEERIRNVHANMEKALQDDLFDEYRDAYVYVERTLHDGKIRRGLIGCVDLEEYDSGDTADAAIRATEKTVPERIPVRRQIRDGAMLELPHVLLLMDDDSVGVIEQLSRAKESLPLLYDLDLMKNGGHLSGWLVQGEARAKVTADMDAYMRHCEERSGSGTPVCFASGDGNHSLAAAKACYEAQKANDPSVGEEGRPERYALVELENLQDPVQEFEPIHRVLFDTDTKKLRKALERICAPYGMPVTYFAEGRKETLYLDRTRGKYALAVLQPFLDAYVKENGGVMDYIHGTEALVLLSMEPRTAGFLLPAVTKDGFFANISESGVYPRKTFSIGEAEEKRYYMEARRIRR